MDYYQFKKFHKIKLWVYSVFFLILFSLVSYYFVINNYGMLYIVVPLLIFLIYFYIKLPSSYKLYLSEKEFYITTPVSVNVGAKWNEIKKVTFNKNRVYLYTSQDKKIVISKEWEYNQQIWLEIYVIITDKGHTQIFEQSFINLINNIKSINN